MANAYKCDICGDLFEGRTNEICIKVKTHNFVNLDLCDDCLFSMYEMFERRSSMMKSAEMSLLQNMIAESIL